MTFEEKRKNFEEKLKHKKEMNDLKEKYEIHMTVTKWTLTFTKKAVITILILTLAINAMFFFYIVPHSGVLSMTDSALEASSNVLLAWNAGTAVFLMGYMAKALFETKWEEDNKRKPAFHIVTESAKKEVYEKNRTEGLDYDN